jgi:hypothetical protein
LYDFLYGSSAYNKGIQKGLTMKTGNVAFCSVCGYEEEWKMGWHEIQDMACQHCKSFPLYSRPIQGCDLYESEKWFDYGVANADDDA